ncbi:hydroxyacylglutathione hydrolase [Candidatus Aerophobetes bacterium]|uniref:Hydroxyacylglutathione hydrolase n=1 Tax=Aerophobetes bacterium TaxID=2030807 RepID=A0A2A4YFS3_UNCAE|nr:MAG: hydroxyacylglutathione hydrolase [Candidatus Aerophobetes bacterium]
MSLIHIIPTLSDNYTYLVENNSSCAIVDPGEADPVISYLKEKNLTPVAILLTHDHLDHYAGVSKIKESYDVKVFGNPGPRFADVDVKLHEGKVFEVVGERFEVIATPGHTMAHVVLFFPSLGVLFSGDTLFAMGCGRLFEGSPQDMLGSFKKLKRLPKETKVYAGHEYTKHNLAFARSVEKNNPKISERDERIRSMSCTMPFTLQEEFETNPFFRVDSQEIQANMGVSLETQVFAALRKLRDTF